MAISNERLYPPIVDTYVPAGVGSCDVYFSISAFNKIEDIKCAMVTVTYQRSNLSALKSNKYPSGVLILSIKEDKQKNITDDRYYVTISSDFLELVQNEYYKVQIRFSSIEAPTNPKEVSSWMANNLDKFSEWSTVTLMKFIQKPTIELNNIENNIIKTFSSFNITGRVVFSEDESDSLESYRVTLSGGTAYLDSGIVYPSNRNEINYLFKQRLEENKNYNLTILITTKSLYEMKEQIVVNVLSHEGEELPLELEVVPDNDRGLMQIKIVNNELNLSSGNFRWQRTSSRTNFTEWETLMYTEVYPTLSTIDDLGDDSFGIEETEIKDEGNELHSLVIEYDFVNYVFEDTTVESGVWYKYSIQAVDAVNKSAPKESATPAMVLFEDMFINGDGKSLRISFNPKVTNYKKIKMESKTDTLGSQFPFLNKNGKVDYRQFSISGMISFLENMENNFISKEELYGNAEIAALYESYNQDNRINEYNDFILEREFRNKVEEYLSNNSVKLIKTLPEGNIIVKLTDINLMPEETLGRYIYSFSATAYEIDDHNLENINKYAIL